MKGKNKKKDGHGTLKWFLGQSNGGDSVMRSSQRRIVVARFKFQWLKINLLGVEDLHKLSAGCWRSSVQMLKLSKMMSEGEEEGEPDANVLCISNSGVTGVDFERCWLMVVTEYFPKSSNGELRSL